MKDYEEYGVENTEEAIAWLEKKFAHGQQKEYRESRIQNMLDKELLPHLGATSEAREKKAIFLGRIVRQVLEMAITNRDPNDKDHYANIENLKKFLQWHPGFDLNKGLNQMIKKLTDENKLQKYSEKKLF